MDNKALVYSVALRRLSERFTEDQAKRLALYVVAQAQHETGNFSSDAFKRNNNIAGYKPFVGSPYQKNPQPFGTNQKYAFFPTVDESVLELADWLRRRQAAFNAVDSIASYAMALKNAGYYEDTVGNYSRGLTFYFSALLADGFDSLGSIVQGNFSFKDVKPLGFLLCVVVAVFWIFRKLRL